MMVCVTGYNEVERCAIERFGTTVNPERAGFILRDGTMLDFGRVRAYEIPKYKYVDTPASKTFKVHEEVRRCLPEIAPELSGHEACNEFLKRTGAVRWDCAMHGYAVYMKTISTLPPTESQLDIMAPYFGRERISLDIYHPNGSRCNFSEWRQPSGECADKKLRRMWRQCYNEYKGSG